jgi:adenosylcobinamide kinase/adenosylcobinamide-phosphate guanylyltransferase
MALVLFSGGARSGKSGAAQRLAESRAVDGAAVAVVVFGREDDDAEFAQRVSRHREHRPAGFRTIEAQDTLSWASEVDPDVLLVVDCVGTLLGLAMEEAWEANAGAPGDGSGGGLGEASPERLPDGFEATAAERFSAALDLVLRRHGDTIVVTNEVGDGIVPTYASGRLFRDLLGRANRLLADRADAAFLCVAGRLMDLSLLPRDASWPED